tara:strand:+ start:707 stop:1336 length:630 start_codon:yes stop_codon:yes gene_type:complete
MSYATIAKSRITPKFRDAPNFNKILEFLTEPLDDSTSDIEIIKNMKNIDNANTFVLNEIGILLGVARPILKIGISVNGFFQYGVNGYEISPYAGIDDALDIRDATDDEYRRLLKAVAKISLTRGTIDEVVSLFNELTTGNTYIINGNGSFSIIFKRDLTAIEKALIEVFSEYFNILCVEKTLLGTIPIGGVAFQYGVSGYGTSQYIEKW